MGNGPSRSGRKRVKCRGPLPIAASLGAWLSRAAPVLRGKTPQNARYSGRLFLFDQRKKSGSGEPRSQLRLHELQEKLVLGHRRVGRVLVARVVGVAQE